MGGSNETPRYDQRIHALVSERQKRELKEMTEGDTAQYQSMSQLVRTALEREIADENPMRGGDGEMSAELQKTVMDMADTLDNINARLGTVETRLDTLEVESDDVSSNVHQRVIQALPTPPEGKEAPDGEQLPEKAMDIQQWAATAAEVASQVDGDKETVEKALDQLNEDTGVVQGRYGGEPERMWYFRRA